LQLFATATDVKNDPFETIIRLTIARLPQWARDAMENIEILVSDEADTDLHPDGRDLLGLYVGTPLPQRDSDYAGELPDVIYIFRRPHLELGLNARELEREITTTLIHEIGHYFGLDDDRIDELGWG
jgi:predicted Zn-dependent protease with MMP-like domain